MADEQLHMIGAVYPTKADAEIMIDTLESMHRGLTITLHDAAVISKDAEGKIDIDESDELTSREGATRGALIGGTIGLIFPPSLLVTGLLGGVIGGLIGKIRDTGIENSQMNDFAEQLQPGSAGVLALVDTASVNKTQNAMTGFEGELTIQPLSEEASREIYKAKGKQ